MSLPVISVKEVKPSGGPKRKFSNFLLTINTNKRPRTQEEAKPLIDKLRETMQYMLSAEGLKRITRFLLPAEFNKDYIASVKSQFNLEIGETKHGKRVHSHAIIQYVHTTRLHLNFLEIKKIMIEHGWTGFYMNVKLVKGMENAFEYLLKGPRNSNFQTKSVGWNDYSIR